MSSTERLEIVSDFDLRGQLLPPRRTWWRGWLPASLAEQSKKKKSRVANRDLWSTFIHLVADRGNVKFLWVKGHGVTS